MTSTVCGSDQCASHGSPTNFAADQRCRLAQVSTNGLEMREISPGVAEVYAGDYQAGVITWNPEGIITAWYATYANGDETIRCADREAALECIRLQHAAVQRFARSLRSLRPASERSVNRVQVGFDRGYNNALRDVERLTQEVVGQAPEGQGYTAITR